MVIRSHHKLNRSVRLRETEIRTIATDNGGDLEFPLGDQGSSSNVRYHTIQMVAKRIDHQFDDPRSASIIGGRNT